MHENEPNIWKDFRPSDHPRFDPTCAVVLEIWDRRVVLSGFVPPYKVPPGLKFLFGAESLVQRCRLEAVSSSAQVCMIRPVGPVQLDEIFIPLNEMCLTAVKAC